MPSSPRPKAFQPRHPARDTLNLRVRPEVRGLIERAAALLGKTRTDFMLEASQRAAEEALLDRALFSAGPDAFEAFRSRLDAPPGPNVRLLGTMSARPPWRGD